MLRSLRPLPVAPRILLNIPRPLARQLASPFQRFKSEFRRYPPPPPPQPKPRKVFTRWNPEDAQNAEPLIRTEKITYVAKHRTTTIIVLVVLGGGTVYYFAHIEEVPVSGRRRFMCYSDETVEQEGMMLYRQVMQEYGNAILPVWDKRVRMVNRVMENLIPASGLESVNWEVHVIDSSGTSSQIHLGARLTIQQKQTLLSFPEAKSSCSAASFP